MSEFLTVHPPNLMLLSWPYKALCSNDFNTLLYTKSSLRISPEDNSLQLVDKVGKKARCTTEGNGMEWNDHKGMERNGIECI
ncbi:hypothetical protein CMV_028897 [Castanea mollissima]|uniref:Uncharacterized protein n=1 Tax=Castanea mollissima TaxID=60419 RepID=A0A8J4VBK1_9ROSI|nr:hypothetical protein CMV_028897 [Castanea mollissima]